METPKDLTISFAGNPVSLRMPGADVLKMGIERIDHHSGITGQERTDALFHFLGLCMVRGDEEAPRLFRLNDEAFSVELEKFASGVGVLDYMTASQWIFANRPDSV